jgi:anti-anti-sigma factor
MQSKRSMARQDTTMNADPPGLRIVITRDLTGSTVHLVGEVDMATVGAVRDALRDLTGPIVVDCSNLDFIDAIGLGVLAGAADREGGVKLTRPSPFLRRVLEVVGMHTLVVDELVELEDAMH